MDREFDWWDRLDDSGPTSRSEDISFLGIMMDNWSPDELAHMHLTVMEGEE